jgi:hypothetical protein
VKDTLKIGLGIVIGFICLGALCCGGIVLFGSALPSAEEVTKRGTPETQPIPAGLTPTMVVPALIPTETAEKPIASPEVPALGNYITSDGLKLGVMEYRVTNSRMTSWGEEEKPTKGAKFISFRIYVENIGETAITFPNLFDTEIIYKGENIVGYAQCDAEWDDYGACIWERVYPGTSCEGWRCYEIPQAIEPSELTLRLNVSSETFGAEWHSWRLE